jgi:hypothetical protein
LRRDHYAHISAVALHLVGGEFQLGPFRVYHNPFARRPLPARWLQASDDRHFQLANPGSGAAPFWKERCDHGS